MDNFPAGLVRVSSGNPEMSFAEMFFVPDAELLDLERREGRLRLTLVRIVRCAAGEPCQEIELHVIERLLVPRLCF